MMMMMMVLWQFPAFDLVQAILTQLCRRRPKQDVPVDDTVRQSGEQSRSEQTEHPVLSKLKTSMLMNQLSDHSHAMVQTLMCSYDCQDQTGMTQGERGIPSQVGQNAPSIQAFVLGYVLNDTRSCKPLSLFISTVSTHVVYTSENGSNQSDDSNNNA